MNIIKGKLLWVLVFLLASLGLQNCEELPGNDLFFNEVDLQDLTILPIQPSSSDQIFVVEEVCGNESDVILSFEGMQIRYLRYFNSLMMMPCIPGLDTTIVGTLDPGTYQLIRCVIDRNHLINDNIVFLDTIPLTVR